MLRAFSLVTILLALPATQFTSSAFAATPSAGPAAHETAEVPFSYVGDHLIAVRGSIGARENLTFLVDLGTTYTLVDRKIASQIEHGEKLDVSHFSGSLSANEVILPSLTVGALRASDFHAYLTDLAAMPVAPAGIAGVIGMDFLSRQNVTFDFASQKIVFTERVSGEHQTALEKCAVGYAVLASWKGEPVKLVLSNGVAAVTLDRSRMNDKPVKLRGVKPGILESTVSVTPVSLFKTNDLVVSNVRLRGDGVLRKIEWPVASDHLDGFLPLSALRASRVSLDFGRGLLLWDGSDDKIERAQRSSRPAGSNSLRND
jgi:aspartyl protease